MAALFPMQIFFDVPQLVTVSNIFTEAYKTVTSVLRHWTGWAQQLSTVEIKTEHDVWFLMNGAYRSMCSSFVDILNMLS